MNTSRPNPIICAVDTTDIEQARALAAQLSGHVGALKLGLEFFTAQGAAGVREMEKAGLPIFLDLKFHDIPNTVAGAVRALHGLNVFMLTVHVSGGEAMIQAAKEEASKLPSRPKVIGVTVLTSLEEDDIKQLLRRNWNDDLSDVKLTIEDYAANLGRMAHIYGLDGAVCSPHEVTRLKKMDADFTLVVPGIRPAGSGKDDQKRTMTPAEAMAKGADYLVIGRPITAAKDPKKAAADIFASLGETK
ncbi:MAG: orotidine-5'-phosphate decarboxylase [Pseudomonadota bacterium]|nr:orotidine-5'-phosphate decarboxylase [Pseudomonadota bacterium]MDE3037284.1 orotidine-5'-phosphate decarboxylase [Pseudomonadota bacterium]